ncbi:response regulator transcription factor [Glutamicibacter sp. NPDC087344]|uniref:helix-turn-helix transcriptional regulator n=1 Tax=Glutamicibacter sp. NPDC087344 TaxID=3363994 RepID=UPI0037FDA3B0
MIDSGQLVELADARVTLASELHRRVLGVMTSSERSAELFQTWKEYSGGSATALSPSHLLWGMKLGLSYPTERVLNAASAALDSSDYPLAWELCRVGNVAHTSGQGALFEADVLLGLGRFESARNILLRFVRTAKEPHLLTLAYSQLLVVVTNLGNNLPLMGEYIQQWQDWAESLPPGEESLTAVRDQQFAKKLLVLWTSVNSTNGQRPAPERFEQLINDPQFPDQGQIIARLMSCDVASVEGRSESALKIAQEAAQLIATDPKVRSLYETRLMFLQVWNLLQLGDNLQAQRFLASYRYGGPHYGVQHQGAIAMLTGLADLLQGRNQSAVRMLAEAVTELRFTDPGQVLSLALNLYAKAREQAGTILKGASSDSSGHPTDPPGVLGELPSRQRIFARASATSIGHALGEEKLRDFPIFERMALAGRVSHLPDEQLVGNEELQRLMVLCREHEGNKSQLLLELSEYRSEPEPRPLEELAQKAFRHQEVLIGVEALARAAVRYSNAGEPRTCGTLLRQASRVVNEHRINPNKYVARALALTELTAREAEIVQLALSGKNNSQIARALTVSQRTVEGHLYRVFSKLGISERSELGVAELDFGAAQ